MSKFSVAVCGPVLRESNSRSIKIKNADIDTFTFGVFRTLERAREYVTNIQSPYKALYIVEFTEAGPIRHEVAEPYETGWWVVEIQRPKYQQAAHFDGKEWRWGPGTGKLDFSAVKIIRFIGK